MRECSTSLAYSERACEWKRELRRRSLSEISGFGEGEFSINNSEHNEKSIWKGTIIFGFVNLFFVRLCSKLSVMLISFSLILMIVCGICVSFQAMKEDWAAKRKVTSLLCGVGLLINLSAMGYYIAAILGAMLKMFLSLF